DLHRVHDAAVAKCDMDDGLRDGIISDPPACAFDPAELSCARARGAGCLAPEQVEALKKIYAGPMTSSGFRLLTGGPMPGSELMWIDWMFPNDYSRTMSPTESMVEIFAREWFRYQAFMPDPGPAWNVSDFDFDREYRRFAIMESLYTDS